VQLYELFLYLFFILSYDESIETIESYLRSAFSGMPLSHLKININKFFISYV